MLFCDRCWMLFCDRCWMLFYNMCWTQFCDRCFVCDVVLWHMFFFYDRCFVTGVVCCFVTGVVCCFSDRCWMPTTSTSAPSWRPIGPGTRCLPWLHACKSTGMLKHGTNCLSSGRSGSDFVARRQSQVPVCFISPLSSNVGAYGHTFL